MKKHPDFVIRHDDGTFVSEYSLTGTSRTLKKKILSGPIGFVPDPNWYSLRAVDIPLAVAAFFFGPVAVTVSDSVLEEITDGVTKGAIDAFAWAETPMDAEADDDRSFQDLGFDRDNLGAGGYERIRGDCEMFVRMCLEAGIDLAGVYHPSTSPYSTGSSQYDWEHIGHDFHLSRNGHGAGFFDREHNGIPHWALFDHIADRFSEINGYISDTGNTWNVE